MITKTILDEFIAKFPECDLSELDVDSANDGYAIFDEAANDTLDETSKLLEKHKNILETQMFSLNSLALYCHNSNCDSNRVLKADFPGNDTNLGCALINIANTANAILKLCLFGFTSQAKTLYRTLLERVMQVIILFHSNDDFLEWRDAVSDLESKDALFQLFSKKERLHKKFEKIEIELFKFESKNVNSSELRQFRKSTIDNFSQSVHGASNSVLIESFSCCINDEDRYVPAAFGRACLSSQNLLDDTIFQLWYFMSLLRKLMSKVHSWQPDYSDDLVVGFELYRFTAHRLFEAEAKKSPDYK